MRSKAANRVLSLSAEALESRTLLSTVSPRVISYLPDYSYNAAFSKLDWNAITQVDYFSIVPASNGTLSGITTSSSGFAISQLDTVVSVAHAHGVKVSVVLDPSSPFTTIDADATSNATTTVTKTFATQLQTFANAHHLDGVDFDWEPDLGTKATNANATSVTNYGAMLNVIHTMDPNLSLSVAVNPERTLTINNATSYIVPTSAIGALDTISLMAYDLDFANHAPYQRSVNDLAAWGTYVTSAGFAKTKLVLGVPFYARSGTSWNNSQTDIYSDLINAYVAQYGHTPDPTADSVTLGTAPNTVTWYFNGPNTMALKAQYVLANGYGGMMTWELGQDHYTGSGYDSTSLLPAIKSAMGFTNFATLASNQLTLTGDSGANTFTLGTDLSGDTIVTSGNSSRTYQPGAITSLLVHGGGGSDTLNINAGRFTIAADASADSTSLAVNVAAAASAIFNTTQHLRALDVAGTVLLASGANKTIVTSALSVEGDLDLYDNGLIVNYTGDSPYTAIQTLIKTARDNGQWDKPGLTSTTAGQATPADTTLGIMESSDYQSLHPGVTFDGQTLSGNAVLIKYTYYGDANFDGQVNFDDYSKIDSGYTLSKSGWINGDFNNSGAVNFDDYSLIDSAFTLQGQPLNFGGSSTPNIVVAKPTAPAKPVAPTKGKTVAVI